MLTHVDPVLRHPFAGLSDALVDRETYLLEASTGRRVIHFGFLDSIFLEQKLADGSLLHARLGKVTTSLYGVDVDAAVLARYRHRTGDLQNLLWDIADGSVPEPLQQPFDLILFPEVLEHVPNPGTVLTNLADLCRRTGAQLCLTAPNCFEMYGFMAAMHGIELIHPDHCYTFTPFTLSRLLQLAGFKLLEFKQYNFGSALAPGITKAGMVVLCEPEDWC